MSVTFMCPGAPREKVPCRFCEESWAEFPEGNGKGGKCDQWCEGFTMESVAPVANFANANARSLLTLLGLDDEHLCGSCDAATMRQRLFRALNSDRTSALRDSYELEPGHAGTAVVHEDGLARIERRGPRVVGCGNTDEQTLRRLASLEALAVWAQDNGREISWG